MLAAGRTGRIRVVRALCAAYSSFVRAVPVVTFMMLIYFGLPALGIALDPFPAAVFALALNNRSVQTARSGGRRSPTSRTASWRPPARSE